MIIFIGSDHRGFEMKQQLTEWLKKEGYEVEDCGNDHLDPEDDYVDFAKKVVENMQSSTQDSFGIFLCGSGIGVSIVANRYEGIRCALGFDRQQVQHGRENDHINGLSIPSDYVDLDRAKEMIHIFLTSKPKQEGKYISRIKKVEKGV